MIADIYKDLLYAKKNHREPTGVLVTSEASMKIRRNAILGCQINWHRNPETGKYNPFIFGLPMKEDNSIDWDYEITTN